MRVACLSEISEAAPHNSASRFGERFFAKPRFEKRRIGGKDPPKRADAIARCCPVIIPNVPAPDKIQCVWAVRNFLASLRSTRK